MAGDSGNLKSFEELECWKACTEVRRFVSRLVAKFPKDEKFRLVDQMLRAARSSTHNIAEGFGRFHYQENVQFCRQSRGSLYELRDQLLCSLDDGMIEQCEYDEGIRLLDRAAMLLNGYIRYLKKRKLETGRATE